MEARELRIGNIVEMGSEGVCAVSGYNLYQLTVKENGAPVADYYHNWKPIPLTEDWLIKFGFEKDAILFTKTENDEWNSKLFIQFDREANLYKMPIQNFFYHIETVHQLQNLYFALTGSELEVKQTTEVN